MKNYLKGLEGKVYKCIPIFETDKSTLGDYLNSLLIEMEGARIRFPSLCYMSEYTDILNTVVYFANAQSYSHFTLRKEIFKCMSILNRLNENGGVETD